MDDAAETLAAALVADPLSHWTYGTDDSLEPRLAQALTLWLAGLVDLGVVWSAGDGAGFAAWLSPDDELDVYTHDLHVRDAIKRLTLDGGRRHDGFWDWADALRLRDGRRWYLDIIGVSAPERRRGVGAALVEHGLGFVRAEAGCAGVMVHNADQVAYFGRFGFAVMFEGHAPDGGPYTWIMGT